MNETTKKYTTALNNPIVLLASIASLAVGGLTLVNTVLSIISSGGIIAAVFNIINLALYILLGIGLLLVYKNAKENQMSSTGAMLVRVPIMIQGIASFVGYVLISLAILIVGFILVAAFFSADAATGFGVLLLVLLVLGIFVMISIAVLRLTTTINSSFKGFVNGDENLIKTKGVTFSVVFLLIFRVLGVISSIIQLVALDMLLSTVNRFSHSMSQMQWAVDKVLSALGMSEFYIVQGIINIIVLLLICTLYICCMMFFKSIRKEDKDIGHASYFESLGEVTSAEEKADKKNFEDDNNDTVLLQQEEVKGQIVSLSGADKGYVYPIGDGEVITIGKDAKVCSIVVPVSYQKISRKHCEVRYSMGQYEVIDFSTNGTYINNTQKLEKGVYVSVPKGTIINLGKENISFKLG